MPRPSVPTTVSLRRDSVEFLEKVVALIAPFGGSRSRVAQVGIDLLQEAIAKMSDAEILAFIIKKSKSCANLKNQIES